MKKLFIIGNGFDSAHGLKTSYNEFRKFICDNYMPDKSAQDCMPCVPEISIGPKGEEICDMDEVAEFLVYLISVAEPDGDYWSELEISLGKLDYSEAFDELPEMYDKDGDIDEWKTVALNEDMALRLNTIVPYVKIFFEEWIETIDIDTMKSKPEFKKKIDKDTIFLTFNYTETLECVYHIDKDRICHIHGKSGEDLLFGHGDEQDYYDEYMRKNIGSEFALYELDMILKKDTKQALENHMPFFEGIDNNVQEVYSIGFSYGDVDLIYIKEICRRLPVNTIWYLNDFDLSMIPEYQNKIRKCGFKGKFSTFHI